MIIPGSRSHQSPDLVMLPYVRFKDEKFAPERSALYVLTPEQFADIQELLDEK